MSGTSKIVNLYAAFASALQFKGKATTETDPGNPLSAEYYISSGPGIYQNFGNIEVTQDLAFLIFNGETWEVQEVPTALSGKTVFEDLTQDGVLPDAAPSNTMQQFMVVTNNSPSNAQLSLRKATRHNRGYGENNEVLFDWDIDGDNVLRNYAIEGYKTVVVPVNQVFSLEEDTSFYIYAGDDDFWSDSILTVTFYYTNL